jgi:hypothetical protein
MEELKELRGAIEELSISCRRGFHISSAFPRDKIPDHVGIWKGSFELFLDLAACSPFIYLLIF